MFCQLVEEKYENWNEHHPASEIEFKPSEQTEAGGKESVTLEITAAGEDEPKEWKITSINTLQVYSTLHL